jgi:ATP-binding cassette subfamily B protein
LDQFQISGFQTINQIKNVIVTFLGAYYVIESKISLGSLLSISYIIGALNSPLNQLITFLRSLQDAKISYDRLNEVQNLDKEEKGEYFQFSDIKMEAGITFNNVTYQYEGPKSPKVIDNLNINIPFGKVTAIVGASGSGKTTLLKLLLRFYDPISGEILFGDESILNISPKEIRNLSGIVQQEGYIFSDSILRNIIGGDEEVDHERLENALVISNIKDYVDNLPNGIYTKIGAAGLGLSGGQRQRLLISRAVYKNPLFILFDEATSALDASNESIIQNNLTRFFKGKTVLIIAHRLSTVKNGKSVESGTHNSLIKNKSFYYKLVKDQLELGS